MKKIILSAMLMASTLFLTGCFLTTAISTTILVSNDRRTSGEILDDKGTQLMLLIWQTNENEMLEDAHLNFLAFTGTVLVTGEVPTAAVRDYLTTQIPLEDSKIKKVINEVRIAENSSLFDRIKDSSITGQIEVLFLNQEVFNPVHVKVTTENRTVYLVGSVTQREANHATKIASMAKGVKRIVKLFHYLKNRPAAEIEHDKQKKIEAENEAKKAELQRQNQLSTPAFDWGK
ncbi:hypothetical protein [uncultured Gammaproteobacteria bacterium]|uniref:BON domain-containing protein n=1 Tax=Bathymodiolus heckerae thiotrophic gill symbiont TaxID=1052212 RepID=UPI0010B11DCD|nr:BON domain-containing protein [Bathymodiolus heckerae thiotrophic gill symbiont]CAC9435799.1 hypothetical protein [uncultured Gammaproteobacteria bacterium]SMN12810.1 21 kDa hemolysin precursor [Bathymodiolus heckerae thiotrophic gill symbiont]SMN14384.1 21 kDa hemolysin precursor [uncultured Candidatus Thioglobus sp.]